MTASRAGRDKPQRLSGQPQTRWTGNRRRRLTQALCLLLFLTLFFYFSRAHRLEAGGATAGHLPPVDLFLNLDPLVGLSTALAARAFVGPLVLALAVLVIGVIFPRWFCGYVCPLGTLIDLFDWTLGRRVQRFRLSATSRWVHLRFYFLTGIWAAALFGVLLSGFGAAIPVLTRGMQSIAAAIQAGLEGDWHELASLDGGQYFAAALLLVVLGLGLLRPRFWCAYLCPSGALLSAMGTLNPRRRVVESTCTRCGRCRRVCSFDAIAPDYSTRLASCAHCKRCQRVCPQQSIRFVGRWSRPRPAATPATSATAPALTRRGFFLGLVGAGGAGIGAATGLAHDRQSHIASYPIRPPGSVPEVRFRRQCIRCGQCVQVCPANVLRPAGFELGIDGIWTPTLVADAAGCDPSCNRCGQACPTGAIRDLALDEKRAARLGLAVIDENACLPHCGKEACGLCFSECAAAGYHAIEYIRVGIEYDAGGRPLADSGFLAPVVLADRCVGCGLCQARCHAVNVVEKRLLDGSAVRVAAGLGREDRIVSGSYRELQNQRRERNRPQPRETKRDEYLPDFLR